jgi:outer membrane immunogenic protein
MSVRRLSALAAGFLLSASAGVMTAQAADMPAPAVDPWTGFYLGAQAGYMQGSGSNSDICQSFTGEGKICLSNTDDGFDVGDSSSDGVTAGGYLGFNYRVDSFLMGLEGDFNWDNAQDSNSFVGQLNYDTSLNWDASIRARLGLIVDERALLYVTGGPSWLNTELNTNFGNIINAPSNLNINTGDQSTEFGWVLGAGAEYMITDHLSVKAEYIHGWYGEVDQNLFSVSSGGQSQKLYLKEDLQTNVVRAGIAYHFGGL